MSALVNATSSGAGSLGKMFQNAGVPVPCGVATTYPRGGPFVSSWL
jgi:hypothetical protein